ncbi:hypothetical protein, partial [Burkholderia contaminans]|uniref:hypothetical protein n=1 Tax=Burkholderia contaminans TaxID=488447 RepID=UPI001C613052
ELIRFLTAPQALHRFALRDVIRGSHTVICVAVYIGVRIARQARKLWQTGVSWMKWRYDRDATTVRCNGKRISGTGQ